MELRHLKYFIGVAQTLNFRKAAVDMHISQPPLSQQIKDLEYELGVDLFLRNKKRISLTAAGEAFLVQAKKIVADAEQAKVIAQFASEGKIGRLSIRFLSSAVAGALQNLMTSFKTAYPNVQLDIEQSNGEQIMRDVAAGKIDVGLVRLPAVTLRDVVMIPLTTESYFVALPAGHKLAHKKIITPKELKNEKMVIYSRNTAMASYDDIFSIFIKDGVTPDVVQEATEQLTIAGLVASGLGYSIVPECMKNIIVPGVVHVPLKGGKGRTGIALIAKKPFSPTVEALIGLVKNPSR